MIKLRCTESKLSSDKSVKVGNLYTLRHQGQNTVIIGDDGSKWFLLQGNINGTYIIKTSINDGDVVTACVFVDNSLYQTLQNTPTSASIEGTGTLEVVYRHEEIDEVIEKLLHGEMVEIDTMEDVLATVHLLEQYIDKIPMYSVEITLYEHKHRIIVRKI